VGEVVTEVEHHIHPWEDSKIRLIQDQYSIVVKIKIPKKDQGMTDMVKMLQQGTINSIHKIEKRTNKIKEEK
jgi:hypothetical protein